MLRLTTRGIKTAEAIRDRVPFKTSGSLRAEVTPGRYVYNGYLNEAESAALYAADRPIYIVWSFSTPIAWHTEKGGWHIVDQKFSRTTTKHQGNLYLTR